ncbi:Rhodopsin, GQ-coupled [Trichoplax sp. H2]|nr:Rhodopsin, GQ-coupled [Trichoplax sp. H2]|eukprot:RDD39971.1 Rhodopsin, GQ-coupled [Trichoplax sp. H2]
MEENTTSFTTVNFISPPFPVIILHLTISIALAMSLLGILANLYVICVIYQQKRERKSSYYALTNLAVSNLMLAIFYPLMTLMMLIDFNSPSQYRSEIIKYFLCGFIMPMSITAIVAANGTLAFIAYERYYVLTGTTNITRQISRVKSSVILLCIWIIGILYNYPPSFLLMPKSTVRNMCTAYAVSQNGRSWVLILSGLNILVPFAITLVFHLILMVKLRSHQHQFYGRSMRTARVQPLLINTQPNQLVLETLQMLRLLTVLQLTFYFLSFVGSYSTKIGYARKWNPYVVGLSFTLQYISTVMACLNGPILYIVKIKKFRRPLELYCFNIRQCYQFKQRS